MKLVLDTNIILYHLGGRLAAPLPQQAMVSVSVISEMEVLSYPALTEAEETTIRRYLANLAIINLTEPIKQTAISLRRQYKLKLPDAIIAATAKELDAVLLTCDQQLLSVSDLAAQAPALLSVDGDP